MHKNQKKRASQSVDEKNAEYAANKSRKVKQKADQSADEKNAAYVKDCERKSRQRQKARTKVSYKEAQKSQEILDGSYVVNDLKNTDDNIGDMDNVCQYCNALKFKKETTSTCCGNGKVLLDPFPVPPPDSMISA